MLPHASDPAQKIARREMLRAQEALQHPDEHCACCLKAVLLKRLLKLAAREHQVARVNNVALGHLWERRHPCRLRFWATGMSPLLISLAAAATHSGPALR